MDSFSQTFLHFSKIYSYNKMAISVDDLDYEDLWLPFMIIFCLDEDEESVKRKMGFCDILELV